MAETETETDERPSPIEMMAARAKEEGRGCADCGKCPKAEDPEYPPCLWVAGWGLQPQRPDKWGALVHMSNVKETGALVFQALADFSQEHVQVARTMATVMPVFMSQEGAVVAAYGSEDMKPFFDEMSGGHFVEVDPLEVAAELKAEDEARADVEAALHEDGIIEDPEVDGGLLG